ncbi:MAG TPA: TaqI-like C-terminal specificity domain-containing protein [Bacteroidia bacterium]|nr:TaqI-like C-terminal specificity domain-containing protein [Bacteroidia bacterium]
MTKEEAKKEIAKLVNKFSSNIAYYKRADYKETPTRRDFIDPFFSALGWDMDNSSELPEPSREVVHEYSLETDESTEAPDYSFRDPDGNNIFFVEAKKPSVALKTKIPPAFQTRNYAWNAHLKISILTDFEELSIYNTTILPKLSDKPHIARIKYIPYTEYIKEFDFIWESLAKEHVLKGSVLKLLKIQINGHTETVDKIFVKTLDEWREQLAVNIARNNLYLNEEEINFCVQHFIDRLIFLRIAEDRKVEDKGNIQNCTKHGNFYKNIFQYFLTADKKYNSGLFDFTKDTYSSHLKIENETIHKIITELYESHYLFNIIPVEILGIAYEQFLGKVIRLTKSHNAKIELKPEVRKAGGVYYTPQYIVNYIVKNTVTNLIKGKTPEQISKIKIIDPACGSGSFLLGAYQSLLKYHTEYYNKKAKAAKSTKNIPITPDGYLITAEKKRILLNNIFGVDIDTQAVEVSKLSLLLKCMENETRASVQTIIDFKERILPTLDNNIKCGNSLVNGDFFGPELDLGFEHPPEMKAFDWKASFPKIFENGGFDIVIGNPPYVGIHEFEDYRDYYKAYYSVAKGQYNLFSLFIEKSFRILKTDGWFSFIVPSLFIKGLQHQALRDFINQYSKQFDLKEYGDKVFEHVQMPTCIFVLQKGERQRKHDYFGNKALKLFERVETVKLKDITSIQRGLEIGKDKLKSKASIACITGGNIDHYQIKSYSYIDKTTLSEYQKNGDYFSSQKILVRETGNTFFATYDEEKLITTRSIYNVISNNEKYPLKYLLGIINSSLFHFYFRNFIAPDTNIFPKIRIAQLAELPIPKHEAKQQNNISKIEKLVSAILQLKNEILHEQLPHKIELLNNHIQSQQMEIDKTVMQLYKIESEEIKID